VDALVDALRREGRVASRTHLDARGVKTDASGEELRRIAAAVVERRRAEKRQKPGAGE
jgi:tRNA G26 N,N-dimethylase Trm1